ncbi:hypothetical protein Ddye_012698 [Dipteronia dyeriana]|uniref:CCHC-type domain-containing protein n=1 Tax=Dipteronia dyeriana TaxID=168575 RepID=A0AAE0CIW4_9ROSI|nr:hypothetical protein Ddye_012698 [Dipteronia dyeriana]
MIGVEYESLRLICFKCGRYRHNQDYCREGLVKKQVEMETNEVSSVVEDSPFGHWLLVSYDSKYGMKGNGGTGNIGKVGNGNVGNSENCGSKSGNTRKNDFDKVGGSGFKVLCEEMDELVSDIARE